MRTVSIMSRSDCVRACHRGFPRETVVISISDPYIQYSSSPTKTRKNNVVCVLPLSFCDADDPGYDTYGRIVQVSELMSDADAEKVVRVLSRYPSADVVVHCDAGISRSAGLGAAIMKAENGDDSPVFSSPRYCPNMWVYRKTLNALMSSKEGIQ